MKVTISKNQLIDEIRDNGAAPGFKTMFHPEHGFLRMSQSHPYPYRSGENMLVAIPAQNPDGSSLEFEGFQEFLSIEGLSIESNSVEETLEDLSASDEGIRGRWEDYWREEAGWLADEWLDALKKGDWEGLAMVCSTTPDGGIDPEWGEVEVEVSG